MEAISPEGLLAGAERMGFKVVAQSAVPGIWGGALDSVSLFWRCPKSKRTEWLMTRKGRKLLERVPLVAVVGKQSGPIQIGKGMGHDRAGGRQGWYSTLVISVGEVEESFWMIINSLAEQRSRRDNLSAAFDRKVEEEVRRHPDIVGMEEMLENPSGAPREMLQKLRKREAELREERQEWREDFVFVGDDKAL